MKIPSLFQVSTAGLAFLFTGIAAHAQTGGPAEAIGLGPTPVPVAKPVAPVSPVESLIKMGEVYDHKFEPTAALKFYQEAEKLEPNNARVLVRMARQYRHLSTDANSTSEKLRLGGLALSYAQKAVAADPSNAEAYCSVAISYGKVLPLQGKKEQAQASPRIRAAAEKAIALDPRNDLAWHVLGKWHRVLADVGSVKRVFASALYGKLPTGTNADAVHCLQKAIECNPRRPMHYIELGRTYAQMENNAEAKRLIQKGLAMPNTDKDDAETKEKGREVLAQIR
jgi:tetratricopeptide (TPR) repeat protein